ncbi:MAG TPA: S41 family peptidase [Gemmatimonadales bacterium]|jgi:C-terminal processing protease CtpA/Prc|nr:S41 family peptidase [Gemmatimonadales bacterium]
MNPRILPFLVLLLGATPRPLAAQLHEFGPRDRTRGAIMLSAVAHAIRTEFWDPGLKGVPFDSLVTVADSEIAHATGYGQMNGAIAKVVLALDDSHTRFWPPSGVNRIELGWDPYAIGDSVFLDHVDPWAAAPPIGLRVGDRLVAVDGWPVERRRLFDLVYIRRYLQPQPSMVLTVERGDSTPYDVRVPSLPIPGRQYYDLSRLGEGSDWYQLIREEESADSGWESRFAEPAPTVLYWRLRTFAVSEGHVRAGLHQARGKETLILDLRGNHGGYVNTLTALLARVAHADQVGDTLYMVRKREKVEAQRVERAADRERWHGRLIVLIDAESMSASEAFADVVQRLHLGTVLGDRSPGFLTEAQGFGFLTNEGSSVFYGVGIAVAMLERPDGSRVEGVGVMPDELIQPSPDDLVLRRDPVLARALQIAGLPYDPVKARGYRDHGDRETRDWQ